MFVRTEILFAFLILILAMPGATAAQDDEGEGLVTARDLLRAHRSGMSEEAIRRAMEVSERGATLSDEDVICLLNAGFPVSLLRFATGGKRPTDEDLAEVEALYETPAHCEETNLLPASTEDVVLPAVCKAFYYFDSTEPLLSAIPLGKEEFAQEIEDWMNARMDEGYERFVNASAGISTQVFCAW